MRTTRVSVCVKSCGGSVNKPPAAVIGFILIKQSFGRGKAT